MTKFLRVNSNDQMKVTMNITEDMLKLVSDFKSAAESMGGKIDWPVHKEKKRTRDKLYSNLLVMYE